jgi:hypothetical protein
MRYHYRLLGTGACPQRRLATCGPDVTPVTLLSRQAFIVVKRKLKAEPMLLLTAILRVWSPRDAEPNDLLAGIRLRVGHLGLTIIALVYILITLWQR